MFINIFSAFYVIHNYTYFKHSGRYKEGEAMRAIAPTPRSRILQLKYDKLYINIRYNDLFFCLLPPPTSTYTHTNVPVINKIAPLHNICIDPWSNINT